MYFFMCIVLTLGHEYYLFFTLETVLFYYNVNRHFRVTYYRGVLTVYYTLVYRMHFMFAILSL